MIYIFTILVIIYISFIYSIKHTHKINFLDWIADLKFGTIITKEEIPIEYRNFISKSKSFEKRKLDRMGKFVDCWIKIN